MMKGWCKNAWLLATILVTMALGVVPGQDEPHPPISPDASSRQYLVILKRGPKWIAGKSVAEQPLLQHGKYLKELMDKGSLQIAGPFLDGSGGLVVLNVPDESTARQIVENDPGIRDQILEPETIRPFRIAFDATTGKSPFGK